MVNKMKTKIKLLIFIVLINSVLSQNGVSLNSGNNILNARIQCEYKDKDGDSLILNCTLVTGLPSNTNSLNLNGAGKSLDNSGISINSLSGVESILTGSNLNMATNGVGSSSSSNGVNLRVGLDKNWRTPWESLSINHNIIRTFIWRNSKLSELGQYAFKDLHYLQRIDLSYNKLHELNSFTFNLFELDLIELDLSHNLFQQVPFDLFLSKSAQNIEVLKLNDNPIVHLNRKPFELIRNTLKTIELNHCQIRSIDLNTFDDMKQLESISLIGNHLRYLNEYTFRDLNLRSFYIHDNPLVCDCHMRWLIAYLKNVDYQQQTYESQTAVGIAPSQPTTYVNPFWRMTRTQKPSWSGSKSQPLSVGAAAQQSLKCDQPNSLKSQPNFLDINPDSFMCDVQISLRDNVVESTHDLGEDAVIVCDVYGDPEPNIYWSFGQKPIEKALNNEDDKYHINEIRSIAPANKLSQTSSFNTYFLSTQNENGGPESTNKTSELRIKNLQSSDIGYYTCTAEILGSNNRKQIKYNLKQVRGTSLSTLSDASGIFYNSIASLAYSLFNRPLSNWTLLLLLGILVSLIVFILVLSSFICWKCRRRKHKTKLLNEELSIKNKEQEKLLFLNGGTANITLSNDQLDNPNHHHHHNPHYNQTYLQNDSSTTLLSNNKMSNSIRMAYPNPNSNHQGLPINEIYANHSLLTTTSTTTGSYLANANNNLNNQAIAIDTSNHTPRYHLLQQQQQQQILQNQDCYYDDLRYSNEEANTLNQHQLQHQQQSNLYSSPYRQQMVQSSYSPMVRRDDPTIPLYATLKPKLLIQQQQQHQRQYPNNYAQFSTIHRNNGSQNTPPLPMPRRSNNNYQLNNGLVGLPLPPPPPPPPSLQPPVKPKRTFEYVLGAVSRDLHSESGAFLLGNEESSTPPVDYDQQYELDQLNQIENTIPNNKKHLVNKRHNYLTNQQGSTTSLDEEDLDLNDLKDFEDVTFDNLRKPGEEPQKKLLMTVSSSISEINKKKQQLQETEKLLHKQKLQSLAYKDDLDTNNTNSEQSLLLKSSDKSSSENTINNINIGTTNLPNTNENVNLESKEQKETIIKKKESNFVDVINETNDLDGKENNNNNNNSKIYEETEI